MDKNFLHKPFQKNMVIGLIAICLVATLSLSWLVPVIAQDQKKGEPEVLTFGVFAYLGVEQTKAIYEPIIQYLNQQLVYEQLELRVLPMEELEQGIAYQDLDIVTTNPTHFLVIRKEFPLTGVIATLVASEGGQPISQLGGAILTLASREDINTLADVQNKVIGIPSFNHMGGYRAQAYELYLAGVNLPRDAKEIIELEIHQEVVYALLAGEIEVGFVRESILERMIASGEVKADQLKIINLQEHPNFPYQISSRLYPQWPVFALPHVNERSVRHVAAALYSLDYQHPAAQAAGIYGYTIPGDYLVVEELARALRIPPFEHVGEFTPRDVWQRWRTQFVLGGIGAAIIGLLTVGLVIALGRISRSEQELNQLYSQLNEEVSKAAKIHKSNLPTVLPDIEGVAITAYYQPANKMGGDYYDVIRAGDQLVFYISDVSGHSLDGAMMSIFVKDTISNYLSLVKDENITPAKIMEHVFKQYNKENYPLDYFICLFLGVLDLKTGTLSYLGAGLQCPCLASLAGQPVELYGGGLPISSTYPIELLNMKETSLDLPPSSTILVYTDGIVEEEVYSQQYGTERLAHILQESYPLPVDKIKEKIIDDYYKFTGNNRGQDDITFLILQVD